MLDTYGVTEGQTYKSAFKKSKFSNEPTVVWGYTHDPSYDSNETTNAAKPRVIKYMWFRFLFHVSTLLRFFTVYTILEVAIGLFCTYLCCHFEFYANIHPSLVLSAITFPVAFSINASFQRRELSLYNLASQKAAARSLLLTHRDWGCKFEGLSGPFVRNTYDTIKRLMKDQHAYLILRNEKYKHLQLEKIYESFDILSTQNDLCRQAGVPPPMTTQPIHRMFYMMEMFERLRVVCDYRTPSAMRSYNTIFVAFIAVLLSPNFANLGLNSSFGTSLWIPYFVSALVSFTFGSLSTVQKMLENPFDNTQDDINLEAVDHWTVKTLEPIVGDTTFTPIGRSIATREPRNPTGGGGRLLRKKSKGKVDKPLRERSNSLPMMHARDLTGISNLSLTLTSHDQAALLGSFPSPSSDHPAHEDWMKGSGGPPQTPLTAPPLTGGALIP